MKHYDIDEVIAESCPIYPHDTTASQWVPAEVAQRLYDVIQGCKAMGMLTIGYDSGCDHNRLCAAAESALALADGDNA